MSGKPFAAIEIVNSQMLRIACAEPADTGIVKLTGVQEISISPDAPQSAGVRDLSKYRITAILPRHQAFVRKVIIPPVNENVIASMLRYEAEKYLSFALENAVIGYQLCAPLSATAQNEVFLVAAKKDAVEKQLSVLNSMKIFPDMLTVSSFALGAAIKKLRVSGESGNLLLIYSDESGWEIDLFKNGELTLSRGFLPMIAKSGDEQRAHIETEINNTLSMSSLNASDVQIRHCSSGGEQNEKVLPGAESLVFDANSLGISVTSDGLLYPVLFSALVAGAGLPDLLPDNVRRAIDKRRSRKRLFRFAAITAGIVLLVAGVIGYACYRASTVRRQMLRQIEQMGPELARLAKLDASIRTVEGFSPEKTKALDVLRKVSVALPANVYARQFSYDEEEKTFSLQCRTNGYPAVTQAMSKLSACGMFSGMESKGARSIKIGDVNLVDFEIAGTVK